MLFASILIGSIFTRRTEVVSLFKKNKVFNFLGIFILSLIFAFFASPHKYTAFFGDYLRKNGLLQYLCLSIVFIGAVIHVNKHNVKKIYALSLCLGIILSFYGVMQHYGNDFISWNNPYNPVILTVGNPNFAAALMAILFVINIAAIFDKDIKKLMASLHLLVAIFLLITIIFSNARQGLLSGLFGFSAWSIIIIYKKNRVLGIFSLLVGFIFGILAILGMLQAGPLSSLLYKGSVSIRGYYWRAAVEMFRDNPIFGVGLDSYGLYFKQYRETQYSLNHGFSITSSNAHNTFLQFFSTGGFFVGISYLCLTLSVLYVALKKIISIDDEFLNVYTGIFGAWLTFQAQSLISIDNIGISVWNWVLSGLLVGLAFENSFDSRVNLTTVKTIKTQSQSLLLSWSFFLMTLILVSILYRGENSYLKLRDGINPSATGGKQLILDQVNSINDTFLIDPQYKLLALNYLIGPEYNSQIEEQLLGLIKSSPRNLDYLGTAANFFQNTDNLKSEIFYRKKIVGLDPWNAQNLLALGLAYKATSQYAEMLKVQVDIMKFASSDPIGRQALIELQIK